MDLTVVYVTVDPTADKPSQYLFEETPIIVSETQFPDLTELLTKLEEVTLSPPWTVFRREVGSIFWRFSEEKFLPIVDYLSYKCFLSLNADGRLYILSPRTSSFPPACLQAWLRRGISCDSLDSYAVPPEPCSELSAGTSCAFTQNVRLVEHLLKGVPGLPALPAEPAAKGKKGKKDKKNKSAAGGKKEKKKKGK